MGEGGGYGRQMFLGRGLERRDKQEAKTTFDTAMKMGNKTRH